MRSLYTLGLTTVMIGAVGCGQHQATPTPQPAAQLQYTDQGASALAFTPPVAFGEPPVVLAREAREPSVFIGFDEVSATSFYIRTDDRQTDDMSDRHMRRAVIQKVGVTYR